MNYIRLLAVFLDVVICSVLALICNLIDRSHTLYFKLSKVFSKSVLWFSGIELKMEGLDNFDPSGSYVYVCNHSSMADIPSIMAAVPNRASIIFKKELGRIPLFGWQLTTGPYVLIDRQNPEKAMKSIERAKYLMTERGISMILFAEGTRSKTGEVQPFKRGAFYLASKVNQPIIPVSIKGTESVLPKGSMKFSRGEITVVFDKPITAKANMNRKEEIELMEKVREIIIINKGEYVSH